MLGLGVWLVLGVVIVCLGWCLGFRNRVGVGIGCLLVFRVLVVCGVLG